jgi:CubicO group peptidase (beta-lactamase class C family)
MKFRFVFSSNVSLLVRVRFFASKMLLTLCLLISICIQSLDAGRAVDERTLFRVYSMTKVVTAIAGLQAYEAGKFHLDDPIGNYLPAFNGIVSKVIQIEDCLLQPELSIISPRVGRICYSLVDAARPISVRDVFNFSAGLGYGGFGSISALNNEWEVFSHFYTLAGVVDATDTLVALAFSEEARDGFCLSTLGVTYFDDCLETYSAPNFDAGTYDLEEWVSRLARVPLIHQPGAYWFYGVEADVLGALVEAWNGRVGLDAVLTRDILQPLGMKETFFYTKPEDATYVDFSSRFLNAIVWDGTALTGGAFDPGNVAPFIGPQLFLGGGSGLVSSITDWARFAEALLKNYQGIPYNGVVLLSSSTLEYACQVIIC